MLKEFDKVRIVRLRHDPEYYGGGIVNSRPPQVGDTGTIVDIQNIQGVLTNHVVEASSPDGIPDWLSDFSAEELEPVA